MHPLRNPTLPTLLRVDMIDQLMTPKEAPMKLAQWKNSILLTSAVILITLLTSSCREQSRQQESLAEGQLEGQEVTVILGSLPDKTSRYLGTYDEVTGVDLTYYRSDGLGQPATIALQLVTDGFGGPTPTSRWVGTLENVIPGANYSFEAVAYDEPTAQEIADCEARDLATDWGTDFYTEAWLCYQDHELYEPINSYTVNLFDGRVDNFQIQAGTNALQLRLMPILKPEAAYGAMPYISKVERPDRFTDAENLGFIVEYKGPRGFNIDISGSISGTCTTTDRDEGTCVDIQDTLSFPEMPVKVCPYDGSECGISTSTMVLNYVEGSYQLPANSPTVLRVTITLSQWDLYSVELLGVNNEITFEIYRDTFAQSSELVFMPTLDEISLFYNMASDSADLSYDFRVSGLSSEIEIYANLDYQETTPLGFPAPYIKIRNPNDGTNPTQLTGLIDKNDLYEANLQLNFVHTPTGFTYTSEYPLPAYGKPKVSLPWDNWGKLLAFGICDQCDLQNIGNSQEPVVWRPYHTWGDFDGDGVNGFQSKDFGYTFDGWNYGDPGRQAVSAGGYLRYATLENSFLDNVSFTNVNFQGANLRNVEITQSTFDGSKFINSLIYNTKFTDSTVHGALFTPEDNSPTTQNLPYTDLSFIRTNGNNLVFTDLSTKLSILNSMFIDLQMNNNLIYKSTFDGMTATGQIQDNDIVQSTITGGSFDGAIFTGTSFVSTSLSNVSMIGTDLSTTWFDKASNTSLYNVDCDSTTILPNYNNIICGDTGLEFVGEDNREFVLPLPSGRNRASYLYDGDADSFRLVVTDPDSIAVEIHSTDPNINFTLRKSGSTDIYAPTDSGTKTTSRDDGNYNTIVNYYTDIPALSSDEYYYVQISGGIGVFYIVSYYDETATP